MMPFAGPKAQNLVEKRAQLKASKAAEKAAAERRDSSKVFMQPITTTRYLQNVLSLEEVSAWLLLVSSYKARHTPQDFGNNFMRFLPLKCLGACCNLQDSFRLSNGWRSKELMLLQQEASTSARSPAYFASPPEGTTFAATAFDELRLCKPLLKACSSLGYQKPTPIQVDPVSHPGSSRYEGLLWCRADAQLRESERNSDDKL